MTVSELIAELQKHDLDRIVYGFDGHGCDGELDTVTDETTLRWNEDERTMKEARIVFVS